jgi:hypothetical protein
MKKSLFFNVLTRRRNSSRTLDSRTKRKFPFKINGLVCLIPLIRNQLRFTYRGETSIDPPALSPAAARNFSASFKNSNRAPLLGVLRLTHTGVCLFKTAEKKIEIKGVRVKGLGGAGHA